MIFIIKIFIVFRNKAKRRKYKANVIEVKKKEKKSVVGRVGLAQSGILYLIEKRGAKSGDSGVEPGSPRWEREGLASRSGHAVVICWWVGSLLYQNKRPT